MKDAFQEYLSEVSTSVKALSTISHYVYWVDRIRQEEGKSWEELAATIDPLIDEYGTRGDKEALGRRGSGAAIAALRQFRDFTIASGQISLNEVDERQAQFQNALAAVRKAGTLTLSQITEWCNTHSGQMPQSDQGAGFLISTLRNYLIATGAENPRLTVSINGVEITVKL